MGEDEIRWLGPEERQVWLRFVRAASAVLADLDRQLQRDGWVARRTDPGDGRAQLVRLTDEGRARIEVVAPKHVVAVRERVFDQLTPAQVEALGAISDALLAASDDVG